MIVVIISFLTFLVALISKVSGDLTQMNPLQGVGVQLFQWNFNSIAKECVYLAEMGYSFVQTSPIQEHIYNMLHGNVYPLNETAWYNSYAPLGYNIGNRLGNEDDFISMVQTCNKYGINVIVDVVLNHLAAAGTSGEGGFNTNQSWTAIPNNENFPDPGYTTIHTHDSICKTSTIDWNNLTQIWYCQLDGLVDIATEHEVCQTQIIDFLNKLLLIGVTGFRVDAAKSINPGDLTKIFSSLIDVQHGYTVGSRPFFAQEIYAFSSSSPSYEGYNPPFYNYTSLGRIIDFTFAQTMGWAFRNINGYTVDRIAGYIISNTLQYKNLVNIVENHDKIRDSDGYNNYAVSIVNNAWWYKQAAAFSILYPFGVCTIHSDYVFTFHTGNNDEVPIMNAVNASGFVLPVDIIGTSCPSSYMCQHRWTDIFPLVMVRKYMYDSIVDPTPYIYTNGVGSNQIWFGQSGRGFVLINSAQGSQSQTAQTINLSLNSNLPAGSYCNMVYGYMIYTTTHFLTNGSYCTLWPGVTLNNNEQVLYTVSSSGIVTVNSKPADKSRVIALYSQTSGLYPGYVPLVTFRVSYSAGMSTGQKIYIIGSFNNWQSCSPLPCSRTMENDPWLCSTTSLTLYDSIEWKAIVFGDNILCTSPIAYDESITTILTGSALTINLSW